MKHQNSPLLTLPTEIRFVILQYVLGDEDRLVPASHNFDFARILDLRQMCLYKIQDRHKFQISILRTCRRLYLEGAEVFNQNTVEIHIYQDYLTVLGYVIPFDLTFNPICRAFRDLRRFKNFLIVCQPDCLVNDPLHPRDWYGEGRKIQAQQRFHALMRKLKPPLRGRNVHIVCSIPYHTHARDHVIGSKATFAKA